MHKQLSTRLMLIAIILMASVIPVFSQNEPITNIGKTLSEVKAQFPNLRFIEHTTNGDNYQVGYTEDGVSAFYTFKDNRVISECVMVRSKSEAAKAWFDKVKSELMALSSTVYNEYDIHQLYSNFTCHLYFTKEKDEYRSALYYYEGGWKDGIIGTDFYEMYKK